MIRYLAMLPVVLTVMLLAAATEGLPSGKGKEIVQQQCISCHALKVVTAKRANKDQWATLVDQMITRGAQVEDEDIDTVVDYLAKNFGPSAPASASTGNKEQGTAHPLRVNTATAAQLAAGLGISAKESAAIVAYRGQNGKFKSWQDLTKVPGIDSSKFECKKYMLTFCMF